MTLSKEKFGHKSINQDKTEGTSTVRKKTWSEVPFIPLIVLNSRVYLFSLKPEMLGSNFGDVASRLMTLSNTKSNIYK